MYKKILAGVVFLAMAVYLCLPANNPLIAPPNSIKSAEPADLESPYRLAFYTNLSRDELRNFYFEKFGNWGLKLILPPEDAFSVIRDQTRSSYLEEFVHPGRDEFYLNAFVPVKPSEQINVNGTHYLNKVTIRYVPSTVAVRLTVLLGSWLVGFWIIKAYAQS